MILLIIIIHQVLQHLRLESTFNGKKWFLYICQLPSWDFLTLKQPLPIKSSFVIPPCLWVFSLCRFSPRDALKIFCWCLGNHLSIKSGFEKSSCGFPDSSVGKESPCNAGDPGSIPGLGRSAGEGIGYPFQYSGYPFQYASHVAQLVKNPPTMWETWVWSLGSIPGLGRSPGEGKDYPLQYSGLENSMDYSPWTHKARTWLSDFHLTCGLWREAK